MSKLFSPYQISKMSDAAIRSEYSRLRSIANKRLGRLQAQDLNLTARTGYRFPTIQQIQESSRATVASELADVSKFLRDPRTTVTGEKRFLSNFKESMISNGYGNLVETNEDVYNAIQLLDDIRQEHGDKLLPSNDILDVMSEAERLNIPSDMLAANIEMLSANIDKLERVTPTKGGRAFSTSRMKSLIKKWS